MRCSATTVFPVPGTAVHDERTTRSRADDGVLVCLDGAEHVAHLRRPTRAQHREEGRLVVEGGVPLEPVRREHLVPVVADPAAGPAVPAAAHQTHGVGVGRSEEGLSRGRAPVEQQPPAVLVGEAEPSDVHRLRVVLLHDAPEAEVQAEPTQRPQACGQPVDLEVAVHRLASSAAGFLACGVDPVGQVSLRLGEAPRDGREVLIVLGDQRRLRLVGVTGKVERAGGQGVHDICSESVGTRYGR